MRNDQNRTVGELSIDNGVIRGYTLELPKGTDSECQSECTKQRKAQNDCKRILRGTYNFTETVYSLKEEFVHKSLRIDNVPGRDGILIHRGVNARIWSSGCILAMRNNPTIDADNASPNNRSNQINDSENFCVEIVNYIRRRNSDIKSKYGIQQVEMKVIITENNEIND